MELAGKTNARQQLDGPCRHQSTEGKSDAAADGKTICCIIVSNPKSSRSDLLIDIEQVWGHQHDGRKGLGSAMLHELGMHVPYMHLVPPPVTDDNSCHKSQTFSSLLIVSRERTQPLQRIFLALDLLALLGNCDQQLAQVHGNSL